MSMMNDDSISEAYREEKREQKKKENLYYTLYFISSILAFIWGVLIIIIKYTEFKASFPNLITLFLVITAGYLFFIFVISALIGAIAKFLSADMDLNTSRNSFDIKDPDPRNVRASASEASSQKRQSVDINAIMNENSKAFNSDSNINITTHPNFKDTEQNNVIDGLPTQTNQGVNEEAEKENKEGKVGLDKFKDNTEPLSHYGNNNHAVVQQNYYSNQDTAVSKQRYQHTHHTGSNYKQSLNISADKDKFSMNHNINQSEDFSKSRYYYQNAVDKSNLKLVKSDSDSNTETSSSMTCSETSELRYTLSPFKSYFSLSMSILFVVAHIIQLILGIYLAYKFFELNYYYSQFNSNSNSNTNTNTNNSRVSKNLGSSKLQSSLITNQSPSSYQSPSDSTKGTNLNKDTDQSHLPHLSSIQSAIDSLSSYNEFNHIYITFYVLFRTFFSIVSLIITINNIILNKLRSTHINLDDDFINQAEKEIQQANLISGLIQPNQNLIKMNKMFNKQNLFVEEDDDQSDKTNDSVYSGNIIGSSNKQGPLDEPVNTKKINREYEESKNNIRSAFTNKRNSKSGDLFFELTGSQGKSSKYLESVKKQINLMSVNKTSSNNNIEFRQNCFVNSSENVNYIETTDKANRGKGILSSVAEDRLENEGKVVNSNRKGNSGKHLHGKNIHFASDNVNSAKSQAKDDLDIIHQASSSMDSIHNNNININSNNSKQPTQPCLKSARGAKSNQLPARQHVVFNANINHKRPTETSDESSDIRSEEAFRANQLNDMISRTKIDIDGINQNDSQDESQTPGTKINQDNFGSSMNFNNISAIHMENDVEQSIDNLKIGSRNVSKSIFTIEKDSHLERIHETTESAYNEERTNTNNNEEEENQTKEVLKIESKEENEIKIENRRESKDEYFEPQDIRRSTESGGIPIGQETYGEKKEDEDELNIQKSVIESKVHYEANSEGEYGDGENIMTEDARKNTESSEDLV